jgi:hypothetical protein
MLPAQNLTFVLGGTEARFDAALGELTRATAGSAEGDENAIQELLQPRCHCVELEKVARNGPFLSGANRGI